MRPKAMTAVDETETYDSC